MSTAREAAIQFHTQALQAARDTATPNHLQITYQLFCSSVIADPTFALGWYDVGNANRDMKLAPAAVAAYRRALECPIGYEPGDLDPMLQIRTMTNLGHALFHMGKLAEAHRWTAEALEGDENGHPAWVNMSLIHAARGENALAIHCAEKAVEINPSPINKVTLAFAQLYDRRMAAGLQNFESRFEWRLPQFLAFPFPKWGGQTGKKLYLVSEQGMGDTLCYARFVEAAAERSDFIYMTVHPELVRLFRTVFQHIPNMAIEPQPGHTGFPACDYWTTFTSLPCHMGMSDAEILGAAPLVIPPFSAPAQWKSQGRKLHVGICWSGSQNSDINHWRSIPVHQFLRLYEVEGIELYSLQVGPGSTDLHQAGAAALIRDVGANIRDVADTYAVLQHLDMVITVESALGHICGMVGKETWIPYSFFGRDYRAGFNGTDPIWYTNHRFFKQGEDARWEPVFDRIIAALRDRVAAS